MAYLAWHRRADAILCLTGESWTGPLTVPISDLDLLHGVAAKAATRGWRRVVEREAQSISPQVVDQAETMLRDLPIRSPFDLRELVAGDVRCISLVPLPGADPGSGPLFASAVLRNLPPPERRADGSWVLSVRSVEELQAVTPPGWIPHLDETVVNEVVQSSPLTGRASRETLLRVDPAIRATLADLAMRAAVTERERRQVTPDAHALFSGTDPGWVRLRAGLNRGLGGHRPFHPWSQPITTVTVNLDPACDDRLHVLLEEAIGEVARLRGSATRFSILVEASVIRTPEAVGLVEDILRRGRKFNCGIVICARAEARVLEGTAIHSLAGCVITCDTAGALTLDHGSGEMEHLDAFDAMVARQGHRLLTSGPDQES